MPLSALAQVVLEPVLELVLYVVGYGTGLVIVPLLSLGRAIVERAGLKAVRPRWHGFSRSTDGRVIVQAEMAAFLGMTFWLLVAAAAIAIVHARAPNHSPERTCGS